MSLSDKNRVQVLDHGFVSLHNIAGPTRRTGLEHADIVYVDGTACYQIPVEDAIEFDAHDTDPANVARMSFGNMNSGRTTEEDNRLCAYLMKNWHTQPFEQIEVWLEMKLPIFVARQFVRHRTVSMNEVSGRYVTLPREWYIPDVVGGKPVGGAKQGQSDTLEQGEQEKFRHYLALHCEEGYDMYTSFVKNGVAPEHARMFLSLNHYTHWMWKQDLHNLFHFLRLRDHNHAQVEAQAYAKAIDQLVRRVLPNCFALYDEYRKQKG